MQRPNGRSKKIAFQSRQPPRIARAPPPHQCRSASCGSQAPCASALAAPTAPSDAGRKTKRRGRRPMKQPLSHAIYCMFSWKCARTMRQPAFLCDQSAMLAPAPLHTTGCARLPRSLTSMCCRPKRSLRREGCSICSWWHHCMTTQDGLALCDAENNK